MTGSAAPAEYRQFAALLSGLASRVQKLETRDVLQNASIGANGLQILSGGGITVEGGGSITVLSGGSISLPTGTLSAGALSISGNGTISGTLTVGAVNASGALAGASLNLGSGGITSGTVTSSGNVSAAGQVISSGIINSPGTKANTVTVGYSAVYIDSSGNMGGNTSSRRFKENIGPASYDLDAFLALPAYSYQRTTDVLEFGETAAPWFDGMMAEDVAPVMPLHVWYDDQGLVEGIRFEELVTPLIQAVARERHERLTFQSWAAQCLQQLATAAGVTLPVQPT